MSNSTSENKLTESFIEAIASDTKQIAFDLGEVKMDSFLDDGILKDIPFLSIVYSLLKIGDSINKFHMIHKLNNFIKAIKEGSANEKKKDKYIRKMCENPQKMNKELEYLLVIINRQLEFDKPKYLAKFYLSFLEDIISWDDFILFASIIEKAMLDDLKVLQQAYSLDIVRRGENFREDVFSRLLSLGLVRINTGTLWGTISDNTENPQHSFNSNLYSSLENDYTISKLGKAFGKIAFE